MIHERNLILSVGLFVVACCLAGLFLPAVAQSQQGTITLSAGDGAGPPGSTANPVLISLENLDDRTTGISFDICRGSYLTLNSCSSTARTPGISCSSTPNPSNTDCPGGQADRILFFSFGGDFIEVGTGPIITLEYDVSVSAPDPSLGFCNSLGLENVRIVSCLDDGAGGCTSGPPYANVTLVPGEFCYINPPSCLGVSPGSGEQGDQGLEVTIVGENTNFTPGGTLVTFAQTGVTVTGTTVDTPTQVRVTVDIAEDASVGFGNVTVTTGTEAITCVNAFQVLEKIESCLSVSPGSGMQGDPGIEVTIVGENTSFEQGVTTVSFQNLGVTVTSVTVDSPTQLRAMVTIGRTAPTGPGNVTVTTGAEVVVCPNAFEVLLEVIFCLDVSPGSGSQDTQDLEVIITGSRTHFEQGTTEVNFANPDIAVTATMVDSPTRVRVLIDIPGNAYTGPDNVTVSTGLESVVCFDAFEVLEKRFAITELRESNPTSASFTVSWVTDGNANGEVHYSTDPGFSDFEIAYDDRGQFHLNDTHHVTLGSLTPETTYYYEVKSGGSIDNNGGLYYSFTTMQIPSSIPLNCPVYGWVYLEDGITPAEGSIVYLELVHAGVDSYWISAIVDPAGVWVLNLGNLFSTLTDDVLFYSAGDPVVLDFQGGSGRIASAQFTVPASCPLNTGTITLDRFISVEADVRTGFNLTAFPFAPMTNASFEEITYTACSLINDIPECNQAYSWNPLTQSWLFAEDTVGICIGNDFPIEAGKGYFLRCDSNATTSFYGKVLAYPLPLTFEPGFNLPAIPYPPDYYTACSLIDSIPATSRAFSWDAAFQRWLSALYVGMCIGDNFPVEEGKGYFTYSTTHIGPWVPGEGLVCAVDGDCDDGNVCTDEVCVNNVCQYTDTANTCDDGQWCTQNDACIGGMCSGTARNCAAVGDECHYGLCDETIDQCVVQTKADGAACNDGLFCTASDQCFGGVCTAGPPRNCAAAGDQCNLGVCDEAVNQCVGQPRADGSICDDGFFCTVSDRCASGVCTAGSPRDCLAAGDQCNLGVCDETVNQCVAQPRADGAACEDGLFCTAFDQCSSGACTSGIPRDCSTAGDACNDALCDENANQCVPQPKADGAACDDGLFCTLSEQCTGGICTGGTARNCSAAGNQCNSGVCDDTLNQCVPQPVTDGTGCDDGLYCTESDVCGSGLCGGTARDCSAAGDACNDGTCDETLNQCIAQPRSNGTTCDDGLYCTQSDACQNGQCRGSGDPCLDDGQYCNGVEYCQEAPGDFICNSTGDPCVPSLTCDESADECTGSAVTLALANVFGSSSIDIALENLLDPVSGVHVDICDADLRPWLHINTSGCSTTARTSDFSCAISDLGGGCVGLDLTSAVSGLIDPGTGAIARVLYTTDPGAPLGDFADLVPQNNEVRDVTSVALLITPLPGTLRECQVDGDCNDSNVCTDDACVSNRCEHTGNSAPVCDDGLFCTENDTCTGGVCSGTARDCSAAGDACNVGVCDDTLNQCVTQRQPNGTPCDDGLYCTVSETCAFGACFSAVLRDCSAAGDACNDATCDDTLDQCVTQPRPDGSVCDDGLYCTESEQCSGGACTGTSFRDCSLPGDPCNDGICDDTLDQCVVQPRADGSTCEDGLFCTASDQCVGGVCNAGPARDCSVAGDQCNDGICDDTLNQCVTQPRTDGTTCDDRLFCTISDQCGGGVCAGTLPRDCSGLGDQCNNGVCNDASDQCVIQPRINGTFCDDGIYCTQSDVCQGGLCIGRDDPCIDNGDYCDGVEYCQEGTGDFVCNSTGDPCDAALTCDEASDVCDVSDVTLTVADTYGYSGTIDIALDNPLDLVGEVHIDVCDRDQRSWLTISTASCSTTARSSSFTCAVANLGGGCVRVDLTSAVSGLIVPGTGAILRVGYTIAPATTPGDSADITPANIDIRDDSGLSLAVTPEPGKVDTLQCITAEDCNDLSVCTNDACVGGICQYTNNSNTCNDGLYCNGTDTCGGGSCSIHTGNPCPETECNTCDEAADSCFAPPGSACTDDGDVCTDDTCNGAGACTHPENTAPCDDGIFCNGADTCSAGACTVHAGSPCPETDCNTCQEDTDSCFDLSGTVCTDDGNVCTDDTCDGTGACAHPANTASCDDGLYCNGADTCSGGNCSIHTGSPCSETECNTCQEATDSCFAPPGSACADDGNACTDDTCDGGGACAHPANTASCDDGLYCNGTDTCSGGACTVHAGSPCPETECNTCQEATDSCFDAADTVCADDGNACTDDTCDGAGACAHPDNSAPCDDGLFCTQIDECQNGLCIGRDDPCSDNGDYCDGVEYCQEDTIDFICNSTGDPCDVALTCDEASDVCDVSDVTVIVADSFGYSGTIDLELTNFLDSVREVHVDICDRDQRSWLAISTASCSTTTRSSAFTCAVTDIGGGCVGVDLTTAVSGLILPGTGAIARLNYTIDPGTPPGDYADVTPENGDIRDDLGLSLEVTPKPGKVGTLECITSGDCNDFNVCTNDACVGSVCQYTNNVSPCDDGLYCNGTDTCRAGTCSQHTGSPCPGTECNTCQEATDSCFDLSGTVCADDGNACTDDTCDGAGACIHPDNTAPCDDGIFCNGADTCSGGACSVNAGNPCPGTECNTCQEATDSCFDTSGTACADDGNECTDDTCDGAGACAHPNNTAPCDDGLYCNGADTCSGGACSINAGNPCPGTECNTCQEDTDSCFDLAGTVCADDGNVCTDDTCDGAGACAHPANTASCDDGLYCNGADTCSGGSCLHGGNPCPETECNFCQEATDSCFDPAGTVCADDGNECTDDTCDGAGGCGHPNNTASCDDGLYCNGTDTCSGGACTVHGGSPCPETECNTCQETTDSCFDTAGTVCVDDGNACTDDTCDGAGSCAHPNNTAPCDDGLYCTQIDECQNGLCIGRDDPCSDNGDYCDGVEYCQEDTVDFICNSTGDPCDAALTCDEASDVCDVSDVTVIVADAYGYAGTIDIELTNFLDSVGEVHVDICDRDQRSWLAISTVSCSTTGRSSAFTCAVTDIGGGCVGVDITSGVAGLILPGTGAIAQLAYTIDPSTPPGDYADVTPESSDVRDDLGLSLEVTPKPGRVGTLECIAAADCDDLNVCTNDACVGNVCQYTNNANPCDDGLYCNGTDTCRAGTCSLHTGSPCPGTECNTCQEDTDSCFDPASTVCTDDGNACTDDTCDGAGACTHPDNTAPCDDGIFCNGADTCSAGACTVNAGNPCPETECNTCQEDTDSCFDPATTACTDDGNECTDDTCDGAGACAHPNNSAPCDDLVACTEIDTCSGGVCNGTPNSTLCSDGNVCTDDLCTAGVGCSNQNNSAPCDDLIACTETDTCSGGVCNGTPDNTLCSDGNVCTDDLCTAGVGCSNPDNTASCDDTLYCNGTDTCSGGACTVHTGNPCPETECNTCQEDTDSCFDPASTVCTDDGNECTDDTCDGAGACAHPNNTAPCDDGLYCNGTDTCSGGSCQHGGSPCLETDCNTCQETTDSCFDLAGTVCADDGNECTDDTCDGTGSCTHPDNTAPCDDGLYCTQIDECQGGLCIGRDDPCIDNTTYCDGVEYCQEGAVDFICNSTGDPCDASLTCGEVSDVCDVSDVTLIVADAYGYSGTIDIELSNALDSVSEVRVDICDRDQRTWLTINTVSCSNTTRSSAFSCALTNLGGGCVGVDITSSVAGLILPGTGAIARLTYTIDPSTPPGDYADVTPENSDVRDDTATILLVTPKPGKVGTLECIDAADCDDLNVCTNDACVGNVCQYTNNVNPCDDSIFCNGTDSCRAGICSEHAGNPCPETECNTCQEDTDSCFDPGGTVCTDDGNTCTDDTCDGAGACAHPNNTASCDDGLYCNGTDTCGGGSCSVHTGSPCPETDCNTCQEDTDSCFDPASTVCTDDGNICTDDTCNGTGVCEHPNNTASCDDLIACTEIDTCSGGVCNGTPNSTLCSDGNVCTDDLCTAGAGCSNPNNTAPCDDLIACTEIDTCSGGVCNGTPNSTLCSDGNVCTDDLCTAGAGCSNPDNTASCDDLLFCNGADTCSGGSCQHAGDPCAGGSECNSSCQETTDTCYDTAGTVCTDDGNVCTDDTCDGAGACGHPVNTAPCDDLLFCNGADTCSGGDCTVHAGDPCVGGAECNSSCQEASDTCYDTAGTACTDDGNVCTDDTCDGAGACGHPVNTAPCDDTLFCNGTDTCSGGACVDHSGDPCTLPEVCDEGSDQCVTTGPAWWNSGWLYRKAITINASQVNSDLTNYPLLVEISDTDLALNAQPDGSDIFFTGDDGTTKLDHEIVAYSAGALTAWVRVPSLSSSFDTEVYMYYGNSTPPLNLDAAGVWDANYVMVQHLDEASGTHFDATDYLNDSNVVVVTNQDVAGSIDGADDFNGTTDYVRVPDAASLQFGEGSFTAEAWINPISATGSVRIANNRGTGVGGSYAGWQLKITDAGGGNWRFTDTGIDDGGLPYNPYDNLTTSYPYGVWYQVVMVYEADTALRLYVNGVLDGEIFPTRLYGSISNTLPTVIGASIVHQGDELGADNQFFDGIIDEVRLSNIDRDADWIQTSFTNQNNPGAFYGIGVEAPQCTFDADCDDGLYCNGADTCSGGSCQHEGDPCTDNGSYCDGVEYCQEDVADFICSSTGDPCVLPLTCDDVGAVCEASDVTLSVTDTFGYAGTIPIELDNSLDIISEVHLDLCDIDLRPWLTIDTNSCSTTTRSSDFTCTITPLITDGCVGIDITTAIFGTIGVGTGPIAQINYTLDATASLTDFADLNLLNIDIKDDSVISVSVTPIPGRVRAVP